jgi:hypothetical protein
MNKWEYKTVKVSAKGWFVGGILDENEFNSLLNSLGQDGWELVSTFDTNMIQGQSKEIIAVLKRLK